MDIVHNTAFNYKCHSHFCDRMYQRLSDIPCKFHALIYC